ncbi:c6 transcription factor [Neofusicoccum parvum]|uniref:C6 transcription factor n=1 Tax=Neofusicoccum parvum TaxID=310453 RepID=A0ACB5RVM7_9PEZI|nr:c6 transcription factor [Neofusicoccum parvum]
MSPSMYYHTAVLLLFRPFLKARFTESDLSPREVCRQSANTISNLFAQHLKLYSLDGIFTFQLHCLLTACTIHIIKLPSISATTHLAAACNSFQDLVKKNDWATSSLNIIKSFVQKWNIVLPLEVEAALYRGHEAPTPVLADGIATTTTSRAISLDLDRINNPTNHSSTTLVDGDSTPNSATSSRPEKREAYPPAGPQALPKRQRLAAPHVNDTIANTLTKDGGFNTAPITKQQQQPIMKYLFAPFPNQPAPLLSPIHTSTSHNGSGDEEANGDAWDEELRKVSQGLDGLNFVGDDGFDPFMGYQGD